MKGDDFVCLGDPLSLNVVRAATGRLMIFRSPRLGIHFGNDVGERWFLQKVLLPRFCRTACTFGEARVMVGEDGEGGFVAGGR